MNQKLSRSQILVIVGAGVVVAALGLASRDQIQAKEGQFYMAGPDGAKIATVLNMNRLKECLVQSGTLAYAGRETYIDLYEGGGRSSKTLLTEVDQNGPNCGWPDFIPDNPAVGGWILVEDSKAIEESKRTLCKSDLHKSHSELNALCYGPGRKE